MRIAVTPGEPAGIGPDVLLQSIQGAMPGELVAIACPELLQKRAAQLGLPLTLHEFDPSTPQKSGMGHLSLVPIELHAPCQVGQPSPKNAAYVLHTLQTAHELCMHQHVNAIVTGPIHKSVLGSQQIPFRGHTEFFAQCAGISDVLMCFYHPEMIVALATTHYALNDVSQRLTPDRVNKAISLLIEGTQRYFKAQNPVISILGLNPHAGEDGHLGTEEETIIKPVIKQHQSASWRLVGPLAADTAFTPEKRLETTAYLAMYHDQGLIPIKTLYFNQVVNVTLGLPYLRTSVDHGTACALAGTGKANADSLMHVLKVTQQLIAHQSKST